MTRYEVLQALSEVGLDHGDTYHDGLQGYFSWEIRARNGNLELTVTFEDGDQMDHGDGWDDYTYSWVLNPTEVSEDGKRI